MHVTVGSDQRRQLGALCTDIAGKIAENRKCGDGTDAGLRFGPPPHRKAHRGQSRGGKRDGATAGGQGTLVEPVAVKVEGAQLRRRRRKSV
jgi:hypothetical protein